MKALFRLTIGIALIVPIGIVTAGPVGSVPTGIATCTRQVGAATVSPSFGKTTKTQTIKATISISGCRNTGKIKSGTATMTFKQSAGCPGLKVGTAIRLTEKFVWNTKNTGTLRGIGLLGVAGALIAFSTEQGVSAGNTLISFAPPKASGCSDASPLKKLTVKGVEPIVFTDAGWARVKG